MAFKLAPIADAGYPPEGTPVCYFCGHVGVHNEVLRNFEALPSKEYATHIYLCDEGCFNLWVLRNQNDFEEASKEGYVYAPWVPFYRNGKAVIDDMMKKRESV
jgi:hypothetical protein